MSTERSRIYLALLVCVAMLQLAGCGSGSNGSHTRTGQVQVRIAWPARAAQDASGRYVPAYASSLFFELYPKDSPESRYRLIVNRPSDKPSSQTVTFAQLLNEGDYVLACSARVGADGQGATVASALVPVTVKQGMNPVDLGLTSTIKSVRILGQPLSVAVGTTVALDSGAADPDGRTLLVPAGALTWTIVSGSAFGTLTPAGLLTATAAGTMRVKLAEVGAGVSSEADITITSQAIVAGLAAAPYPKEYVDLLNSGLVTGHGSTGRLAWSYDLDPTPAIHLSSPIIGANGLVYVMSEGTGASGASAVAIRKSDGTKAWQHALNAYNPFSPVLLSTNLLCIPTNRIGLIAVDALTGVERWRNDSVAADGPATVDRSGHLLIPSVGGINVVDPSNGSGLGFYPGTTGRGTSPAAVGIDGTTYFVRDVTGDTKDGELVAFNPLTKNPIWRRPQITLGFTPVIGPNGRIYTIDSQPPTAIRTLTASDPVTGTVKAVDGNHTLIVSQGPVFGADGMLYIGQYKSGYRVAAYTPELEQVRQGPVITGDDGGVYTPRRITIGSDSTLYVVADQAGPSSPAKLIAYNTADLSVRWQYDFIGSVQGNISIDSDGTVYFLTTAGKLIALR